MKRNVRKMEMLLGLVPCSVDNQKLFWRKVHGFEGRCTSLTNEFMTTSNGQFLTLTQSFLPVACHIINLFLQIFSYSTIILLKFTSYFSLFLGHLYGFFSSKGPTADLFSSLKLLQAEPGNHLPQNNIFRPIKIQILMSTSVLLN